MTREQHWDHVYTSREEHDFSWFEAVPTTSVRLLEAAGLSSETCVVDVGGGDSRLVDVLVSRGLTCLAVVDISTAALRRAQTRLGTHASVVTWIRADVTGDWSVKPMDIWHDRAVFHFLTESLDRSRYLDHLRATVKPHGSVVIATFALNGPTKCSGLPVARYSSETLSRELGDDFRQLESVPHLHRTPSGAEQFLVYSRFTRVR